MHSNRYFPEFNELWMTLRNFQVRIVEEMSFYAATETVSTAGGFVTAGTIAGEQKNISQQNCNYNCSSLV